MSRPVHGIPVARRPGSSWRLGAALPSRQPVRSASGCTQRWMTHHTRARQPEPWELSPRTQRLEDRKDPSVQKSPIHRQMCRRPTPLPPRPPYGLWESIGSSQTGTTAYQPALGRIRSPPGRKVASQIAVTTFGRLARDTRRRQAVPKLSKVGEHRLPGIFGTPASPWRG